jgi:lipid-A-disaccharide synthase-like uncharacterized protein
VQWVASERAGESTIPKAFWYLSIVGSLVLLVYAIHLENIVFTLAYLPNTAIYLRNLALIRERATEPGLGPLGNEGSAPGTAPGV